MGSSRKQQWKAPSRRTDVGRLAHALCQSSLHARVLLTHAFRWTERLLALVPRAASGSGAGYVLLLAEHAHDPSLDLDDRLDRLVKLHAAAKEVKPARRRTPEREVCKHLRAFVTALVRWECESRAQRYPPWKPREHYSETELDWAYSKALTRGGSISKHLGFEEPKRRRPRASAERRREIDAQLREALAEIACALCPLLGRLEERTPASVARELQGLLEAGAPPRRKPKPKPKSKAKPKPKPKPKRETQEPVEPGRVIKLAKPVDRDAFFKLGARLFAALGEPLEPFEEHEQETSEGLTETRVWRRASGGRELVFKRILERELGLGSSDVYLEAKISGLPNDTTVEFPQVEYRALLRFRIDGPEGARVAEALEQLLPKREGR